MTAAVGSPTLLELQTSQGPARVHVSESSGPRAALVLGHGAGGGVGAPDLRAASAAALDQRFTVVLVEQPYRVAGRRSPPPGPRLDAAWAEVIVALRAEVISRLPLIVGGRSSGARVACRTAAQVGADGVICLAFPLLPPRRARSTKAAVSRAPELDAVTVPVLVVQGRNDRFGMPSSAAGRTVVQVAGDHSLRRDVATVKAAVTDWLAFVAGATR